MLQDEWSHQIHGNKGLLAAAKGEEKIVSTSNTADLLTTHLDGKRTTMLRGLFDVQHIG